MDMVDPFGIEFAYVQVANVLAARIEAGEFIGRLPTERELACAFGVSYQTLRRGLGVLRERGLVITRYGRGSFVACPARPWRPGSAGAPARRLAQAAARGEADLAGRGSQQPGFPVERSLGSPPGAPVQFVEYCVVADSDGLIVARVQPED